MITQVGRINSSQDDIVVSEDGISPTHTAGHGNTPKIAIKQETKTGYVECDVGGVADLSYPNSKTRRGRVQDGGNTSPTLMSNQNGLCKIESAIRIRKLTPRECFILTGFSFFDCDKAKDIGVSDSQLYRQAGNGIITNCCSLLAEHLYKAQYDETYICTDEKYAENFTNPQVE
jgi:DNA (cytosine-5)-methyltransferase 1